MVKHFYVGKVPDAETTKIPSDAFDLYDKTKYGIVNFAGLDRPDADISRSALAGANASRIGGSQISERNIVLTVRPWISAEINRQELYDNLPFDTDLRFYIVTENRCVFIDGRVEKLGGGRFTKDVTNIQISIICPFPWFQSVELHKTRLDRHSDNLIYNTGDIPAGFIFRMDEPTDGTVFRAFRNLVIDVNGTQFLTKKYDKYPTRGSFHPPVVLSTIPGKKSFGLKLEDTDFFKIAFSSIDTKSQWPVLQSGKNIVKVSCTQVKTSGESNFEDINWLVWRDTYSGV